MPEGTFMVSSKVTSKGRVTIPKCVRDVLGVSSGDRVTFIVERDTVHIVDFAVYAMKAEKDARPDGYPES